jgi:hypothetical protein
MYHFTNYSYALEADLRFNPEHPTSLLYEKQGGAYKLIGVMYTASARFSEAELDQRIPLSVAQWHEHVNFCMPPGGSRAEMLKPNARFGMRGSIATKEECDTAGGNFVPRLFGWMVHVYPFEQTAEKIWSLDRQMQNVMEMEPAALTRSGSLRNGGAALPDSIRKRRRPLVVPLRARLQRQRRWTVKQSTGSFKSETKVFFQLLNRPPRASIRVVILWLGRHDRGRAIVSPDGRSVSCARVANIHRITSKRPGRSLTRLMTSSISPTG